MKYNVTNMYRLALILIATLMVGCAGQIFEDKPAKVVIRIKTTEDLNPDTQGRPSPIVLRIYTLKTDSAFNNARFFELYENGEDTLGNDLVGVQEIEISPNETRELDQQKLDINARYVGILAAYRDLDNAVWRGTLSTPVNEKTFVEISLGRLSVAVAEGKKRSGFLK